VFVVADVGNKLLGQALTTDPCRDRQRLEGPLQILEDMSAMNERGKRIRRHLESEKLPVGAICLDSEALQSPPGPCPGNLRHSAANPLRLLESVSWRSMLALVSVNRFGRRFSLLSILYINPENWLIGWKWLKLANLLKSVKRQF
jgi:hypothetical protein